MQWYKVVADKNMHKKVNKQQSLEAIWSLSYDQQTRKQHKKYDFPLTDAFLDAD